MARLAAAVSTAAAAATHRLLNASASAAAREYLRKSMSVAKVNQLIGSSAESFEDATRTVVERANRTLRGITGVRVLEKRIKIEDGRKVEYRVRLQLSFDMAPATELHW